MRIKYTAAALVGLVVAGFSLVALAQQKPAATAAKTATPTSVVVYKSPT
jgi:hypothetical protein